MRCQDFEVYLSGYLDKELPQQQRQKVQLHLEGCSHCNEVLEQLRQAKTSTEQLVFEMPSGEEWTDLQNHILGRVSRRAGGLILIVWAGMMSLYGAYWYAANSEANLVEKVVVFGLITGIGLLFLSVLSERLRESRTDRYKGVHR